MGLAVFVLLAALAAVAIAYPLLRPRGAAHSQPRLSDAEVEVAVQRLRRAGKRGRAAAPTAIMPCPACNTPYQPGDRFCVRCGQTLSQPEMDGTPVSGSVCPSCGAALREDDRFCARCGHRQLSPGGSDSLEEVQS
jgi:hypothetical protein